MGKDARWDLLVVRVSPFLCGAPFSGLSECFPALGRCVDVQDFGEWNSLVITPPRAGAPKYLHIAVTCFDSGDSWFRALSASVEWGSLATRVRVSIITNNPQNPSIRRFVSESAELEVEIVSPDRVGHPYLLTWIHREIFRESFSEEHVTHFLYLEDDIYFGKENLEYFLEGEELLKEFGLVPGFMRFEMDQNGKQFAVDVMKPDSIECLPRVLVGQDYFWVNLRYVYQGMYLMSREHFAEFLESESFSPDYGHWGIRERATQGLTFEKVPDGCFSRNFIGFIRGQGLDPRSLVHHLSNKYVNVRSSRFSKVPIDNVIDSYRPTLSRRVEHLKGTLRINRQAFTKRPVWLLES